MQSALHLSVFDTEEGKQTQRDPGSTPMGSSTEELQWETFPLKSTALRVVDRPYILTNMVLKTKV